MAAPRLPPASARRSPAQPASGPFSVRAPSPPVADGGGPLVSAYLPPPPRLRLGHGSESGRRTTRRSCRTGPRASASSSPYLRRRRLRVTLPYTEPPPPNPSDLAPPPPTTLGSRRRCRLEPSPLPIVVPSSSRHRR
jgi:hypothetical protein